MSVFLAATTRPIDVILLARLLPVTDGNRVCNWLKQDDRTRALPITVLTSLSATARTGRGLEAGADDYLTKPYDQMELNTGVYAALWTAAQRDELSRKNDELHVMLRKVEALSITDPLTELYNRGTPRKFWGRNLRKSGSYHASLSCLMMVIDHFKNVNDTCGHSVGDTTIKDIAWITKQGIRDADTLYRWGGRSSSCRPP